MASESGRKSPSVADRLMKEPFRFDFFQAVRLLEQMAREQAGKGQADGESGGLRLPVGGDSRPQQEVVRFLAMPSHRFPAGAIYSLAPARNGNGGLVDAGPADMIVSFMGLTGPSGVLPRHYTRLVIERLRHKDRALADFLDLFNHRAISHFYRAWEKYRFPLGYERASLNETAEDDLFQHGLYCCLGFGTGGLRGRQQIDDECLLYYGGHFAHFPRNAVSLESVVTDYFELPARVLQFHGQWLYLSPEDQSRLPAAETSGGYNNALGVSLVIGRRVWGIEHKFRLRLGPLDYDEFRRFTPVGDRLVPLCQFVRSYAGAEYDFDVQPVLKADAVPPCQLGGDPSDPSFLGWNTWLISRSKEMDADEAVFLHEGFPLREDDAAVPVAEAGSRGYEQEQTETTATG